MAVLEQALAALQTLILVQNHDNNVILAASGGSGGRCEQRCEYSKWPGRPPFFESLEVVELDGGHRLGLEGPGSSRRRER